MKSPMRVSFKDEDDSKEDMEKQAKKKSEQQQKVELA